MKNLNTNKATVAGNIGSINDGIKQPNANFKVLNFTVASKRSYLNKQTEEYETKTEWHNCTAYDKTAERIVEMYEKSKSVYLEGSVQYTKAENGNIYTNFIVDEFQPNPSTVHSINEIILQGNSGQAPVLAYLPSGKAVINFSVATQRNNGTTDWHRCVCFGKRAEFLAEKLAESKPVRIKGYLRSRDYTTENDVKKYVTEVIVDDSTVINVIKQNKPSHAEKSHTNEAAQNEIPQAQNYDDAFKDEFDGAFTQDENYQRPRSVN